MPPGTPLELVRGTLDLMILRVLAFGPQHGYAIATAIQQRSEESLLVEEGALYPALHRLEARGCLEAEWGVSENNRRARYYALTPEGRSELRARVKDWDRYVRAVQKVLTTAEA